MLFMTTTVLWVSLSAVEVTAQNTPQHGTDHENENVNVDENDDHVDDAGCKGGTCPTPTGMYGDNPYRTKDESFCGLWMGPSPIKNEEEHGFGLGLFTGIPIPMGKTIEQTFFGHGEILLAIYASDSIYNSHPPLREYIWDEDNIPEIAVEYPDLMTGLFVPGLASLAPCTSQNYNLKLAGHGTDADKARWSATSDDGGVHRSTHPQAGAFSYRHNVTYVAVRDIAPGEELTVECSDSNFDGGAYYLSRYSPDDNSNVVCLDQNLRVETSSPLTDARGLGVFAKRPLSSGTVLTSTPLVPIHRLEMDIHDDDIGDKQLMLNYVYGHPESDLLLLPNGPIVNYINHHPTHPNAQIQWHTLREGHTKEATGGNGANDGIGLIDRRQEYHHPELLSIPAELVAKIHGKGLFMDIVATRDLAEGEEIFLDYGKDWQQAWHRHKVNFETHVRPKLPDDDVNYQSAERIVASRMDGTPWKTPLEETLDPYPSNVETFCFYEQHDDDDSDNNNKSDSERKNRVASHGWRKFSWNDHPSHPCFRPCTVTERLDGGSDGGAEPTYTVEMYKVDNPRVMYYCTIGYVLHRFLELYQFY
jgi:hypothetical protein